MNDTLVMDQIVNYVSEIVVIKARLQQLIDSLINESHDMKSVVTDIQNMDEMFELCSKLVLQQKDLKKQGTDVGKHFSALQSHWKHIAPRLSRASFSSVTLELDETTRRFGKVLGELQGVLMRMSAGSSSISIIQVLLVAVQDQVYAFPLEAVLEIVKVKHSEIYSVDGNETIRLRDHALGLIRLEKTIGIQGRGDENRISEMRVVVIQCTDVRIGVIVDTLLGEEDIVVKKLSPHFQHVEGISGASILGDGRVALIVDPKALIAAAQV